MPNRAPNKKCPVCKKKDIPRADYKTCGGKCAQVLRNKTQGESVTANEIIETEDKLVFRLPATTVKTREELIERFNVDTSVWECVKFTARIWDMGAKTKNGDGSEQMVIPELCSAYAEFRPKKNVIAARKEIDSMREDALKNPVQILNVRRARLPKSETLYEVSLNDHHFGKLTWAPETGWSDYDTKIAKEIFDDAIGNLSSRAEAISSISKIVMVVGNDLLHFDNMDMTTTAGTRQDADTRYHKVFRITREVIRQSVDRLKQVAPVEILTVPGNHDTLAAWHLGDSLECLYDRDKHVTVNASPNHVKWIDWGDNLIMCTHGDRVKRIAETLRHVMSISHPRFSEVRWREIHVGHFHRVFAEEINGVLFRVLSSLCATDQWHAKAGYVGNMRHTEAFLYHKTEGPLGTVRYNIPKKYERDVQQTY